MNFFKQAKRFVKTWGGTALALLLFKTLKLTWRLREDSFPDEIKSLVLAGQPVVLAHFHEDEWALLGHCSHRKLNVLVSLSEDGTIMARFLSAQGFYVARGSSSRRAAAGLLQLVRSTKTRDSKLVSLAVDGPKGPRRKSKAGVLFLAEQLKAPIVTAAAYATPVKIFGRSWSHAFVPLPFARIQLCYGPVIFYSQIEPLLNEKEKCLALVEESILTAKSLAQTKMQGSAKRL